jgi:thiol:disulfide interchange protein
MDKLTSMMDSNAIASNPTPTVLQDSTSINSTSIWDKIKSVNVSTWVIIVLIFAFLGFNIFVYLAQGTQHLTNTFKPLLTQILDILGLTTKTVVDVTAEGTKTIVSGTATVVDKTATAIQNTVDNTIQPQTASSTIKSIPYQKSQPDLMQSNTLNKALNTSAASSGSQDYEADDSTSTIQQGGSSKAGWCYIGEDRGFRTCAQVGVNDTCMSGDIFPSQEICINPNLRP